MSQPLEEGDYVCRTRPPYSFSKMPPAIYQIVRLYRQDHTTCAQVIKCNPRTLTTVPGSKLLRMAVDRLYRLDPLETLARLGKTEHGPAREN